MIVRREIITPWEAKEANSRIWIQKSDSSQLGAQYKQPKTKPDIYPAMIFRLIPYETTAVCAIFFELLKALNFHAIVTGILLLLLLAGSCVFTFFYLRKKGEVKKTTQLILTEIVFISWFLNSGFQIMKFSWYNPGYGLFLFLILVFPVVFYYDHPLP